jgi:putative ABC transport system permease protein
VQQNWPAWWTDEPVVSKILYRMRDRHAVQETENEVRAILADRWGVPADDEEAVGVWSSVTMLNKLPLDETRGLLFVLAAATLMIGGVGVLNMMIDAVHERRNEIGIRLAVGARRRDVVAQFFIETMTLCLLGGVTGCALGVAATLGLGRLQVPDLVPVPRLGWDIVVIAFVVLVFVGLAAGVVPAWRAARVDPSETLRME